MSGLESICPCGHRACFHPSAEQQSIQLRATGGKYPGECKGGMTRHCRCITSRDQIIANGDST